MGQEISDTDFSPEDVRDFETRLREETHLLRQWFEQDRFSPKTSVAGFELEAWLVDDNCQPVPGVETLINKMDSALVVPELSKFNLELNCPPQPLEGGSLRHLENNLADIWQRTQDAARSLGMDTVMIGILPTITAEHMTIENMSPLNRYHALNQQILKARKGKPITLDIEGVEHLYSLHEDVMTEAAATSFQIHLQVRRQDGARFFNAAKIATASVVAVSTNSPFLFGHDLWEETRIPLFEQSVSVAEWDYAERVTFGVSYVDESILESFSANLTRYPVLLPRCFSQGPDLMNHLRLHNGTIWRWNRPLIGFDEQGVPNLRIEHRVVPAGPTMVDCIANAAFFFGLVHALAQREDPPEYDVSFACARNNFYAAAQYGLTAQVEWMGGKTFTQKELILTEALPMADEGLRSLELDEKDIDKYLGIIRARTESGQTGAVWQRAYAAKCGGQMKDLCKAYSQHQNEGRPVHEWSI